MIPNYYKLLGVPPGASAGEIKRAYRRLARQFHPDLNAQTEDEQIKRVNEAYAVLSDSRKRQRYDGLLRQARKQAEAERRAREPKMSWGAGAAGFVRELQQEMRVEPTPGQPEKAQPKPVPDQPAPAQPRPKMTWMQGAFGFVRELKEGMRED